MGDGVLEDLRRELVTVVGDGLHALPYCASAQSFHNGCRWSPQRLSGYGVTMDREREFVTVSARRRLIVNRAAQAMFMTAVRHQLGDSRR
jgi:hypothetical protein